MDITDTVCTQVDTVSTWYSLHQNIQSTWACPDNNLQSPGPSISNKSIPRRGERKDPWIGAKDLQLQLPWEKDQSSHLLAVIMKLPHYHITTLPHCHITTLPHHHITYHLGTFTILITFITYLPLKFHHFSIKQLSIINNDYGIVSVEYSSTLYTHGFPTHPSIHPPTRVAFNFQGSIQPSAATVLYCIDEPTSQVILRAKYLFIIL